MNASQRKARTRYIKARRVKEQANFALEEQAKGYSAAFLLHGVGSHLDEARMNLQNASEVYTHANALVVAAVGICKRVFNGMLPTWPPPSGELVE